MKYIFKMECITNMHVGSGEANYNIIDNEVQRDVVLTDVPTIHSSSLKGALREHFETLYGKEDKRITKIFGSDKGDSTPGSYKFFSAKLIARPLRVSNGDEPYLLATGKDMLKDFSDFLGGLQLGDFYQYDSSPSSSLNALDFKECFYSATDSVKELEGVPVKQINVQQHSEFIESIQKIIDSKFAVTDSLRQYDLPVMARNVLDNNGISKNLWYEEIVPHKSIFYFIIITPENTEMELDFRSPIQIGANASIGQGYTKITQVYPNLDKENCHE